MLLDNRQLLEDLVDDYAPDFDEIPTGLLAALQATLDFKDRAFLGAVTALAKCEGYTDRSPHSIGIEFELDAVKGI